MHTGLKWLTKRFFGISIILCYEILRDYLEYIVDDYIGVIFMLLVGSFLSSVLVVLYLFLAKRKEASHTDKTFVKWWLIGSFIIMILPLASIVILSLFFGEDGFDLELFLLPIIALVTSLLAYGLVYLDFARTKKIKPCIRQGIAVLLILLGLVFLFRYMQRVAQFGSEIYEEIIDHSFSEQQQSAQ